MPCVEYHQVRSLSILSDDGLPLDLDGEIKGTAPVSIQIIAGAVRMFCEDSAPVSETGSQTCNIDRGHASIASGDGVV
jgi:hypothetical protein